MSEISPETKVEYHLLPGATYVGMAKHYWEIAKTEGLFVSLEEKRRKNPDVHRLAGATYVKLARSPKVWTTETTPGRNP